MGCDVCHNTYEKCQKKERDPDLAPSTTIREEDNESYISFSRIDEPINEFDIYPTIKTKYFFEKTYGNGLYGTSMLIKDKKSREDFIAKLILKSNIKENVENQIEVLSFYEKMQEINYEFLNPLLEIFESNETIFLISPLSRLGNLAHYLFLRDYNKKELKINEIKYILNCIVKGLLFLAKENIPHGNLCLENVLLFPIEGTNKFRLKLSDYGHCIYIKEVGENSLSNKYYKRDIISLSEGIDKINGENGKEEFKEIMKYLILQRNNENLKVEEIYQHVLDMLDNIKSE